MNLGDKIKELRESQGLLQRQLAALLEIDTPMFSKIERGERKAKREQVLILAKYLGSQEDDLLTLWLADQVLEIINNEACGLKALHAAQEEVRSIKTKQKKKK